MLRKITLAITAALSTFTALQAAEKEQIILRGKAYEVDTLISRELGPGVRYMRLRLPSYPLNVNLIITDVANPYNCIETTQAKETLGKTEYLVDAAKRQTYEGHRVLAGANANFWIVSGQPPRSDLLKGWTYSANVRNGKVLTETNTSSDKWPGSKGWEMTGIVGVEDHKRAWAGPFYTDATVVTATGAPIKINQFNKVVRNKEVGLYNSFYPAGKAFMPVTIVTGADDGKKHYQLTSGGNITEIYCNLLDGEQWRVGKPMKIKALKKVNEAGTGTLGNYDLCLVGQGAGATKLKKISINDTLTLNLNWVDAKGNTPEFTQIIAGNSPSMVNGVWNEAIDTLQTYNTDIYSRTGYGVSADGTTVYTIVIDKSTDPVYGKSAGCPARVMCEIARHYGCTDMVNFDAGGSAEMLVDGKIVNQVPSWDTTPRAVANGWFFYSTAPADYSISRLEFDAVNLALKPGETLTPTMLGYNRYGDLIDDNVTNFTLTCTPGLGTCSGSRFTATADGTGLLTATLGAVTVSKRIVIGTGVSGIDAVTADYAAQWQVYNLQGVYVTTLENHDDAFTSLPAGFYILRNGAVSEKILVK